MRSFNFFENKVTFDFPSYAEAPLSCVELSHEAKANINKMMLLSYSKARLHWTFAFSKVKIWIQHFISFRKTQRISLTSNSTLEMLSTAKSSPLSQRNAFCERTLNSFTGMFLYVFWCQIVKSQLCMINH